MEHHTASALDCGHMYRITHPAYATGVTVWMADTLHPLNADIGKTTAYQAI